MNQLKLESQQSDNELNLRQFSKINTCSIAFPSSIFDNVPTPQLEAYLVGQIARAATVFHVHEIVIYDEEATLAKFEKKGNSNGKTSTQTPLKIAKLVKLFEYAECPQYLRKSIFPIEPDLKYAGLINPLESQHHLRSHQLECPYREGIIINNTSINDKEHIYNVDIGLTSPVVASHTKPIELMTRVTVKIDPLELRKIQPRLLKNIPRPIDAKIVSPSEPVAKLNLYWGYYVRTATCLSNVLCENTFVPSNKNFYNVIIGTSERGTSVDEFFPSKNQDKTAKKQKLNMDSDSEDEKYHKKPVKQERRKPRHVLVVFGGIKGLENAVTHDTVLKKFSDNISQLFHYYLNTCPNQGSTTIRTEEAIFVTLSAIRPKLNLTSQI